MGRKLTKFEKIKENIEKIVEEYKVAKSIQDERRMVELQADYEDQKILLYSNEAYFKKLKKRNLKLDKKETEDSQKIKYINGKLKQKKIYSDNKSYINMVEKSESIDDYIENSSHKKRNFIRRHFKKIALGISLVAALITGGTLLSKKNGKDEIKDNGTTIDNTEEHNEESVKINTNGESVVSEIRNEDLKNINNDITNLTGIAKLITPQKQNEESQNIEENLNNLSETTTIVTQQNPNISSEKTQTTIIETIIPEPSMEDQDPQDYIPSIENTVEETPSENINDIVTIEEETTPDYPEIIDDEDDKNVIIDENKPIIDSENTEEKVTIIEKEEQEPLDNPTKIESDEKDETYYDEKIETSEPVSKEDESSEEMPIEEDEEDVIYYENPDVVETDQDIIDFINNNTEIGQIYTLHM